MLPWLAVAGLAFAMAEPARSQDRGAPVDTSVVVAPQVIAPRLNISPFDTVPGSAYGRIRSVTLGHYLETSSGYVVERRGPLGSEASFSRWGFGRGRGQLFLANRAKITSPRARWAPLAVVPESAIGRLVLDDAIGTRVASGEGIEGAVQIVEPSPLSTTM